jgi:hypothetical protein
MLRLTMKAEAGKGTIMNAVRGILLFGAGVFALYKGWTFHTGQRAWFAYGLGLVAIGLGVWRLLRREDKPLI